MPCLMVGFDHVTWPGEETLEVTNYGRIDEGFGTSTSWLYFQRLMEIEISYFKCCNGRWCDVPTCEWVMTVNGLKLKPSWNNHRKTCLKNDLAEDSWEDGKHNCTFWFVGIWSVFYHHYLVLTNIRSFSRLSEPHLPMASCYRPNLEDDIPGWSYWPMWLENCGDFSFFPPKKGQQQSTEARLIEK